MKKTETTLELPADLYQRLASLATAEEVAVPTLLERMVASHRTLRPAHYKPLPGGTILGEAVPHEEIHVWDRPHDEAFPAYLGDYAD
jgi:hypothetical protein